MRPRMVLAALLAVVLGLLIVQAAGASHFRYGSYSWVPAGGNTIDFSLQNVWRRSANPCVDVTTNTTVACHQGMVYPNWETSSLNSLAAPCSTQVTAAAR